MSIVARLTRLSAPVVLAGLASSCQYAANEKIDQAYRARDNCLKWAILGTDDGTSDPAEAGVRAARSCTPETNALVSATDPNGAPAVASDIEADSVFRATGYVTKSRRAASEVLNRSLADQKR